MKDTTMQAETNVSSGSIMTLMKKETKTKVKSKDGEQDFIVKTAGFLENLTEEAAFDTVALLINDGGSTDFQLGGALSVIQENSWLGKYSTFKDLVETQFGLKYRKAMYLVEIYRALVNCQVPWEKVKSLGWTKLRELAPILTSDNYEVWLTLAKGMTVVQLRDSIKGQLEGLGGNIAEGSTVTSTVTTMTFKVHADQKETIRQALDKCKAEVNSEYDTVALEHMCIGYLGGSVQVAAPQQADLKATMGSHTYMEVLEAFEQLWPKVDLVVSVLD